MFYHKDFRSLIIAWNNKFPYDRWWRQKYNVAFNSPQHRSMSQIDIYIEYLEDKLFKEHEERMIRESKEVEDYKKGIIIKEKDLESEIDIFELMKKADYSQVNSHLNKE